MATVFTEGDLTAAGFTKFRSIGTRFSLWSGSVNGNSVTKTFDATTGFVKTLTETALLPESGVIIDAGYAALFSVLISASTLGAGAKATANAALQDLIGYD